MKTFLALFAICIGIFSQLGCGENSARKLQNHFNLGPGNGNLNLSGDPGALTIQLLNNIDDAGTQRYSISMWLKNEDSNQARKWSEFFGDRFLVYIGDRSFEMKLDSSLDTYTMVKVPPIGASDFAKLHGGSISVSSFSNSSGNKISFGTAVTPQPLSNFSESIPALSSRYLSNCQFNSEDRDPGLYWSGRSLEDLTIAIGSQFTKTVPDTGYWYPSDDSYQKIFGKDFAVANQPDEFGDYGRLDKILLLLLTRSSTEQSLKISTNVDQTLPIAIYVQERMSTHFEYQGGCEQ